MKKTGEYVSTQRFDGEWFDAPKWIGCCDCGLVHKMSFRIRRGKLQIRVFQDPRGTMLKRRARKYPMRRPK